MFRAAFKVTVLVAAFTFFQLNFFHLNKAQAMGLREWIRICSAYLENSEKESLSQRQYLAQFSAVKIVSFKQLNKTSGVWIVTLTSGKKYVLRMGDERQNVAFESFASEVSDFLAPDSNALVRTLNADEALAISDLYSELYQGKILMELDTGFKKTGRFSIARYFPEKIKPFNAENAEKKAQPKDLEILADAWVARMVVGEGDFSKDNWVYSEGKPIGVDLASTKRLKEILDTHVLPKNPVFNDNRLLVYVSSAMIEKLRQFSRRDILRSALSSGYFLTPEYVSAVLKMRDVILVRIAEEKNKRGLATHAAAVFEQKESPLTASEWNAINSIFKKSVFVRQNRGDVANHSLNVAMFVNDYNMQHTPQVLDDNAQKLMDIVASPKMMAFYRQTLSALGDNSENLYVRRMQGNSMAGSDYNHWHIDNEYDPDFKLTILLYLTDLKDYSGGELLVKGHPSPIRPEKFSIIAFKADEPHAVAEFHGEYGKTRDSIVILLGSHLGVNRRFRDEPN